MKKTILIIGLLVFALFSCKAQLPARHSNGAVYGPQNSDPSNPQEGQIRYNGLTKSFYFYNGTIWVPFNSGGLQDWQSVTDEGNTTDNDIIINGNTLTLGSATGTTNRFINFNNYAGIIGFDGNTNIFNVTRPFGVIGSTSPNLYVQNNSNFRSSTLYSDNLLFSRDSNNLTLQTPTLTGNHTQTFQDASGTIALLSDISNPTGFESVTESGKTGLRIIGRNAANYGDIGLDAVDGSFNGSASTTHGATGTYSMAFGGIVTSSGTASGAIGYGLLSRSFGEVSVGTYNTDYTPLNPTGMVYPTVDRAFTVGIGTSLGRHDGLTVLRTGSVGINIDNFEAATTGEALQVNGEVKIGAYTLPSTDGTSGQTLQTNGSGNVTWQDSSSGGSINIASESFTYSASTTFNFANAPDTIISVHVNRTPIFKNATDDEWEMTGTGIDVDGFSLISGDIIRVTYTY